MTPTVRTGLIVLGCLLFVIGAVPLFDWSHRRFPKLDALSAAWKQTIFATGTFCITFSVQMTNAVMTCAPGCTRASLADAAPKAGVTALALVVLGFLLKLGQQMVETRDATKPFHDPGA